MLRLFAPLTIVGASCLVGCASGHADHAQSLLQSIQELIDGVSNQKGYGIGVGVVDDLGNDFGTGSGSRSPSGLPSALTGNVTGADTYVLGSGTKPYVSVSVLRLVDQGKLSLNDLASAHVDKPLQKMWNTSLVKLLGPWAASITVGHLLYMRSGLGDIDLPMHDDAMLKSTGLYDPILDLRFLASMQGPFGCRDLSCTWVCAPGTCTSYSSSNYLLAGLVLLAHKTHGQPSWQSFELTQFLGPDFAEEGFNHTNFPTAGPLPSMGLTTAGRSVRSFGEVEIFSQDASIMGWCYGNTVASPRDVAKFFFDLLGPSQKFISQHSLATMQKWSLLDTGWAAHQMQYGAGLEVRNVAKHHESPPKLTDLATFVGHDGETFGFWSNQGWFSALNTSIAVMTSQDHDATVNYDVTCHIVKLIAKHRNLNFSRSDLDCGSLINADVVVV